MSRLLEKMSDESRRQLEEDVKAYGDVVGRVPKAQLVGSIGSKRYERLSAAVRQRAVEMAAEPDGFRREPLEGEDGSDLDEEPSIDDLIEGRVEAFRRTEKRHRRVGVRRIAMPPGPYAIAHFGDPHLDDDGCDWPELLRTIEVVKRTPGMFGGNIGDTTNNWVGRLMALYADQSSTFDDAERLADWFLHEIRWLYVVGGNHDAWNNGWNALERSARGAYVGMMAPDDIRLELVSPSGEVCRLHARHDFPGHSMWNPAHAPMRASKLDGWGDLYVAGHRHEWVAHQEECVDGRVRWAIRTRGFKRFDSYARSKGFYEQQHGCAVTTVHDPAAAPPERIRVFIDVEEAAAFLEWKRSRACVAPSSS